MNLKGIAVYLSLSYLLVFLFVFIGHAEGALSMASPNLFQFLLLAALMGIPALCAAIARHFCPDNAPAPHPIWPVRFDMAARVTLLPIAAFAITYLIATLAGLTYPQWNLAGLLNRVSDQMPAPLPPEAEAVAPVAALVFYPLISIAVGATLFALLALGSEIGWRGYLLPRLLPAGRVRAYALTGLLWGIWFVPFLLAWYRETETASGLEPLLRALVLAIVLGAVLGQIADRARSLGAAALGLGAFAGQASGIWGHLFQQSSPPWTGAAGWIAIGVWGLLACMPGLYMPRKPTTEPAAESGAAL